MIIITGTIRFIAVEGIKFKDSHNVIYLRKVDGKWTMKMEPKSTDSIYGDVIVAEGVDIPSLNLTGEMK